MHDNIDFSKMNTTEDIVNILSKLSFNADNFEKIYYNMYLEETPTDITFRQYTSDGIINELTIPNVAKMKSVAYTSDGDPNGQIQAPKGSFCVDIQNGYPYYKKGDDEYDWILLWGAITLGSQNSSATNVYQTPNGDGSRLNNLNINRVSSSSNPLNVNRGGTGRMETTGTSGILKGNGTNPYSIALDNTDYLGGTSNIGIIMYFPPIFGENGELKVPNGWLLCDGGTYSGATGSIYKGLYDIIGNVYGGSGTNFKVPDLIGMGKGPGNTDIGGYFIRCIDKTNSTPREATNVQDSQNKSHVHPNGYGIGNSNAGHGHSGSTNTTGSHFHGAMAEKTDQGGGNFGYYDSGNWHWGSEGDIDGDNTLWRTSTNGNHSHTITIGSSNMTHSHTLSGSTGSNGGSEFNVKNMALVPLIKF